MEQVTLFFENFLYIANDASPWLLLGLLIAGLMKSWVPSEILSKHLGSGNKAIIKAALIGAPLPLCSCGVIPVATELRRSGASAPATSSFLVATPETGVDSVTVSYALLGPVFAIYRPISAIFSAIITGLLVATSKEVSTSQSKEKVTSCCSKQAEIKKSKTSCCGTTKKQETGLLTKTLNGIRYAATQLIDDLKIWLFVGLLFATIVKTYIPETFLLQYGSGLTTMLLMIVISIPMYICATASTPVAAGFIMAGLSPGTALVFMMAGPATNISTLGVIRNEMGSAVLIRYLLGISLCSLGFGLLFDWLIQYFNINIGEQMAHNHALLPYWLGISCTILFVLLSIKPLRKLVI
ncbi:SO_0444 family Cu/Zn efflux transporter [Thalassotalea piscium]